MSNELSSEALAVAYDLAHASPTTNALWKGDFVASWEEAGEDDERRDTIEVYEIIGVDTCPSAGQKSVHGNRLATLSLREVRERYEMSDAVATQSADVA